MATPLIDLIIELRKAGATEKMVDIALKMYSLGVQTERSKHEIRGEN